MFGNDRFAEGVVAHDSGVSETDNPYQAYCNDFMSWNDGWFAAFEAASEAPAE